jgi:two-component system NtrC family sensor kinase
MTIRFKLTMVCIAVILVANSVLSFVSVQYLGSVWLDEVQKRVLRNLNAAGAAYNGRIDRLCYFLRAASVDRTLNAALQGNSQAELKSLLDDAYRTGGMDLLSVLDSRGIVLYRARNPQERGDSLANNPVVARVLKDRAPARGTIVVARESLAREGADLAAKARIDLVDTRGAPPWEEKTRSDGMAAAAAVPILDSQGRLLAVLYGGELLNRRYEIINAIKNQVFPADVYQGKDIGTVTIFQGDLRIATNVTLEDDSPAVGTRLSAEVAEEVLNRGATWAARAFVVRDWYITAYEPILDPDGRIIGAMYIGLLEAPFLDARNRITGWFLAIVLVATLASLVLLLLVTKLVLHPIGRIAAMSQKVIEGDLSARVGIRPPGEMGLLCQTIDSMADAIALREEQLKQATRQQIGQSEKLAAIGRLAAGVAHEINNPLTGVLTFAHLLRQKENMTGQDKQDLDLIVHETARAAEIVRGLLDFARERPVVKELLDLNEVTRQTLRLIRSQKPVKQVAIVEDLAADLPRVDADKNQLQQVLVNLSLNACEAMPNGGTLSISTLAQDGKVLVKLTDTGCGIKKEHLGRIFDPFFSTKPVGKGTGLGLSVSYGIIQQHGGAIEVESEEGKGSTFTVVLPAASRPWADRQEEAD